MMKQQVRCRFSGALLGDVIHTEGGMVTYVPTDQPSAGEHFAFRTIGMCWVDVWESSHVGRMEVHERAHKRSMDSIGAVQWGIT